MDNRSSVSSINGKIGRVSAAIFSVCILLSAVFWAAEGAGSNAGPPEQGFSIAVLPVENLSGTKAPVKDIRAGIQTAALAAGIPSACSGWL